MDPDFADLEGILLIDELEQHLHPRWQRTILGQLRKSFPKLQIIATTHSPLVASGARGMAVHQLTDGRHEEIESLFGWLAEDVYRWMGVETSRAELFHKDIAEYKKLDLKKLRTTLNSVDRNELRRLRKQFNSLPGSDPIALTSELRNLADELRRQKKRLDEER